jgi:hypothetical protein
MESGSQPLSGESALTEVLALPRRSRGDATRRREERPFHRAMTMSF